MGRVDRLLRQGAHRRHRLHLGEPFAGKHPQAVPRRARARPRSHLLVDDPLVERRVMSEEAARLVTLFLSDPQARLPTFPRGGALEYPFGAAVKTGTSSRFRDAWAVGWTSRHLVGAWVGDPAYRPMNVSRASSALRVVGRCAADHHAAQARLDLVHRRAGADHRDVASIRREHSSRSRNSRLTSDARARGSGRSARPASRLVRRRKAVANRQPSVHDSLAPRSRPARLPRRRPPRRRHLGLGSRYRGVRSASRKPPRFR